MIDQASDAGCPSGFDSLRYIPGLYGPREISGVSRPATTVAASESNWTTTTPVPYFDHVSGSQDGSSYDSQEYLTPEYQDHLENLER